MITDIDGIRLVVGLGNPGEQYKFTRHNAGWQVIDRMIASLPLVKNCEWQPESGNLQVHTGEGDKKLYFLKPLTYMNQSGLAVKATIDRLGISPPEVLVVCDCMDLPVGKLRIRSNGSSGGHRGIESVIAGLQCEEFSRLRVGVGRPEPGVDVVDHVLSDWVSAESKLENEILSYAAECAFEYVNSGYESACRMASGCSADKINAKIKGETEIG